MKDYSQHKDIHPCKLEKNDLFELVKIIKKGFAETNRKEDLQIRSHIPNVSIYENSLEDFLKHKDIPNIINRLSIEQIGWNNKREIDKKVSITFYDNFIDFDVSGFDEEWVLGKSMQIQNFLRKKRTKLFFLNRSSPILFGLLIPVGFYAILKSIKEFSLIPIILSVLFMISIVTLIILFFKGKFLPYTRIIIVPKKMNKENIILLISILTLIISFIGSIIIPLFVK